MGFNKRYFPELKDLKARRESLGDPMFFKIYVMNPDALIGTVDSMNYINNFGQGYTAALK